MSQSAIAEHLSGYQDRDFEVVDYFMYSLGNTGLSFRGPAQQTLKPGGYFTCVGAAQTLGCFCGKPYPTLLAERLGMPALNLGYGGAGPEFFCRKQSELNEYLNNSKFVIVQVMSGRSQSNSLFDCGGLELQRRRSDSKVIGASEAYRDLLDGPSWLRNIRPGVIGRLAARTAGANTVRRVVAETRDAWIRSYCDWLINIKVPVILLWFSKRDPAYDASLRSINKMFGAYPQLIDESTLEQIKPLAGAYVQCVSIRGMPQPLFSRFTGASVTVDPSDDRPDLSRGEVWTHNKYYPSPEMHEDATNALMPSCKALLS